MAAIYADVDDLIDAMEELCPDQKSGYRKTALSWLNGLQLEWQQINPTYEGVRTEGTITLSATVKDYAFTVINAACIAVDVKSFHDGVSPIIFRAAKRIRIWDRAWDDPGAVGYFTIRPSSIRVWQVPSTASIVTQATLYCDYFKRFEPFTAEADLLTQYFEPDRLTLLKGLEWRCKKESEDPEWGNAYEAWKVEVASAGSVADAQGQLQNFRIGLGPYFDFPEDDDEGGY